MSSFFAKSHKNFMAKKKTSPNWEIETLNPNMELFFVSICNFLCKDLKNGQFPEEMSFLTFP